MFPLSAVLFPQAQMPLHIFEPRYRALTRDCLAADSRFGIVLIARGAEVGGGEERMAVGTRAVITRAAELSDGRWLLMVQGESRIRITEWLPDDPYPVAMLEDWQSKPEDVDAALMHRAHQCVRRTRGLMAENGDAPALSADVLFDEDADKASWQLCAEVPVNPFDAHRLLLADGTVERLTLLTQLTEALEQDLLRMMHTQ
jgi:Lon protease-like protein